MADNRKDINVEIRVRNNLVLRVMKERGIASVAELSRQSGISQIALGLFVNMKRPARNKKDDSWYPDVVKLAEFFQCMPEDLFSDRQQYTAIEKNRREAEVTFTELAQITQLTPDRQLELSSEALEFRTILTQTLLRLRPREERVLRMRFGINLDHDFTLREVADQFGIQPERIRQIEARALRMLKHPEYIRKIKEASMKQGADREGCDGNMYPTFVFDHELFEALNYI